MTTQDILEAAADLIAQPGAWTQGASARDANGYGVKATDDAATCWCVMGAISHVTGKVHWEDDSGHKFFDDLYDHWYDPSSDDVASAHWNDAPDRTQAEVVAALLAALDAANVAGLVEEAFREGFEAGVAATFEYKAPFDRMNEALARFKQERG